MTIETVKISTLRRTGLWAAAALVLAFGATFTQAKDKEGKHLDRMVGKMEKELSLTKEQSAKIRTILAKDSGSMPHHGMMKKGKDCTSCDRCGAGKHGKHGGMGMMHGGEFASQLRGEGVDTAALNRSFAERADSMHARMRVGHAKRVATFAEIHAVLTPEQRAKAADKMEKRSADMKKKCEKKCGKSCK
jgi:Spy/CpxP family protein refolding chaperone